ncbi:MAG TPA: hypothetical protein VFC51_11465 [Chloroflexota bacterium]|nr:hypothetical protein [Chloroflexota bacterium]
MQAPFGPEPGHLWIVLDADRLKAVLASDLSPNKRLEQIESLLAGKAETSE